MAEVKTKTLRATDDIMAKLKKISEDGDFSNQGEALAMLIETYERMQAAAILPERATEIADFNSLIKQITDAYLHSLEINANAEERIRSEFSSRLQGYELTIQNLQKELDEAAQTVIAAEKERDEAKKNLLETEKVYKASEADLRKEVDRLKSEIESQNGLLSGRDETIAALRRANASDTEKIQGLEAKIQGLPEMEKQIVAMRESLVKAEKSAEEYRTQAERAEANAQAQANARIADMQEKFFERFDQMQARFNAVIDEHLRTSSEEKE